MSCSLKTLFADHEMYHSEFQQDYIITARSGMTEYGQYKQSLRELHRRYRGLKSQFIERERKLVDIEEAEEILNGSIEDYDMRRRRLDLAEKKMQLEEIDLSIHHTRREFVRFYQQAIALKAKIGELTPTKRKELDMHMWEERFKRQCAIDFVSNGRLLNTTIESINSCPPMMRQRILKMIRPEMQNALLEWYENYRVPDYTSEIAKLDNHLSVDLLIEELDGK